MRRSVELELLFWASRLVILFFCADWISDLGVYREAALALLEEGRWPYRDFAYEYPPLAYLLAWWPAFALRYLGGGLFEYRALFALPILLADYWLFQRHRTRPAIPGAAFLYVFLTGLLPFLLFDRFDLLLGCAIAAPFLAPGGPGRFALAWGLGAALKMVPLLLLPYRWLEERGRGFALAATALPFVFSSALVAYLGRGRLSFLSYHSERGVQIETLLGNATLLLKSAGWLPAAAIEHHFRSHQIEGVPGLAVAAKCFFWATLVLSASILAWRVHRGRLDSLGATWNFLLGFLVIGYVFSPQFLFWLLPIVPLAAARVEASRRPWFLALVVLVTGATGLHFYRYWFYVDLQPSALALLSVRNAALVLLWVVSWRWIRVGKVSSSRSAPDRAAAGTTA